MTTLRPSRNAHLPQSGLDEGMQAPRDILILSRALGKRLDVDDLVLEEPQST